MAYLGDLGTLQVLLPGVSDEAIEFSQRLLMPLQEQSHRASDALIPTLRCYLANGRSTSRAAKVLEVHPNTVNNRLERIAQLTNGSLDDTDHLLDLRLALLIQEILSCGSTNPAPHKEKERHDTSIDRQPRKRPA
jgi:DNA-binding PucR family transcriptional regulator